MTAMTVQTAYPAPPRKPYPWRALPHDFAVTWSSTHRHFLRLTRTAAWHRLLKITREEARTRSGRKAKPSAGAVDSSSVKGTPGAGPRGSDGAKKIDGIKRHITVDTTGTLIAATVTPRERPGQGSVPHPDPQGQEGLPHP